MGNETPDPCIGCKTEPSLGDENSPQGMGQFCARCGRICTESRAQMIPFIINNETIAALRAAAVGVDRFEIVPFEDCESRLWDGHGAHPDWREANAPQIHDGRKASCHSCGESLEGQEFIHFNFPEIHGLGWWGSIRIHREHCTRRVIE